MKAIRAFVGLVMVAVAGIVLYGVVLMVYYAVADGDDNRVPQSAPTRSYRAPALATPEDVAECIVIAKSRGYDVSAIQILLREALEDGNVTPSEGRRILGLCEGLIGR